MAGQIPSAKSLFEEALQKDPEADVNTLQRRTYELMVSYRAGYYESRVDALLSELGLPADLGQKMKRKLLKPVTVDDKEYSNFMEEVSRRISQVFQPVSGRLSELCAERELNRNGLQADINYTMRKERTDIIVYYPSFQKGQAKHRIEVKAVRIRERGTRGLAFDGDSLFGFFSEPNEFSRSNVDVIDRYCLERGGFCYMPLSTLEQMTCKGKRFRENTRFGVDMAGFAKTGQLV